MAFQKDNFEDDNELSRLEDDEELGGEAEEIVEAEEEELTIVGEERGEQAPEPKPAPKQAAKKPAKKAAKKKVERKKKAKKSKPKKKGAKGKKAAKRKKRRYVYLTAEKVFPRKGRERDSGSFYFGECRLPEWNLASGLPHPNLNKGFSIRESAGLKSVVLAGSGSYR